jgi:hypothetical protein
MAGKINRVCLPPAESKQGEELTGFCPMPKFAIVYLDRWGNPRRFPRAFLESLRLNPAGFDYDLIWQLKGYPKDQDNTFLAEFCKHFSGTVHQLRYPDTLYQFNLAFDAARRFDHDFLLFFTSWSRILAPNWLSCYRGAFEAHADCGVVSATGSFERISRDQSFPNINVRTNAFMIDRKLFLSLDAGDLGTKSAGNQFEAGPNSLTRQIERRGLTPILVDRFGGSFRPREWPQARVFRSGSQEALLVADNRTHDYAKASAKRRRKLVRLAWGEGTPVTTATLLERLRESIRWRWPDLINNFAA